jgi:hypothetical protein
MEFASWTVHFVNICVKKPTNTPVFIICGAIPLWMQFNIQYSIIAVYHSTCNTYRMLSTNVIGLIMAI